MNFQEVSVGQKVVTGGYTDALGTPTADLQNALDHTDQALGKMVQKLKLHGLFDSTLIIITAKHGQSPIDVKKLRTLKTSPGIAARPSGLVSDAAMITEDDVALLWLTNASTLAADLSILENNLTTANIQKILSGESLKLVFNDPAQDTRTPDIIVIPDLGTIYTGSTAKISEHGGFGEDDTHVALLISLAGAPAREIKSPVETMQVAPTILQALGLDPQDLQSVQIEKTAVLPGFNLPQH